MVWCGDADLSSGLLRDLLNKSCEVELIFTHPERIPTCLTVWVCPIRLWICQELPSGESRHISGSKWVREMLTTQSYTSLLRDKFHSVHWASGPTQGIFQHEPGSQMVPPPHQVLVVCIQCRSSYFDSWGRKSHKRVSFFLALSCLFLTSKISFPRWPARITG